MEDVVQEIKQYFGNLLTCVTISTDVKLLLPQPTVEYLQNIGLPDLKGMTEHPVFELSLSKDHVLEVDGQKLVIIQREEPALICIELYSGELYATYPDASDSDTTRTVFVNSDIQRYMLCHIVVLRDIDTRNQLLEEIRIAGSDTRKDLRKQYEVMIDQIAYQFTQIDSKALVSGETWWSMALFDLKYMY
jgi:hypothetical protein